MRMHEQHDYVIVGAGSAGCVLASRLSEDPNVSVCLLEAGGPDSSVLIHAPAGVVAMMPTKINNWGFETVPQPGLNGRRGYQPRGKTLGGSSSINAMLYVRGNPWDYDNWAAQGNPGWSYDEVLPYFKRSENNEDFGNGDFHGTGGPLNVMYPHHKSPLNQLFIEAAALNGIAANPDYNGARQDGAFMYQVTQKNGERCSAAKGYLTPNLSRPNLEVRTHAVSARILTENRRATGVAYYQGNELRQVRARREVIVSSGAFGSPQLLMLSGIGPADHLREVGVDVVLVHVHSRGSVRLRSAEPSWAPAIDAGYLTDERDLDALVSGVEKAREIAGVGPLASVLADEYSPGGTVQGREGLRATVRDTLESLYHPVGSCRMGTDEQSVVDSEMRVRGIEGLRVVDASVMPTLVRGNTNAPTMMLAERAADLILGRSVDPSLASAG